MRKYLLVAMIVVPLCSMSCKKKESDSSSDTVGDESEVTLRFDSLVIDDANLALTTANTAFADLPVAASSTEDGLQSLKMYFREIKICESMDVSGSGYSNTKNCVTVYENSEDQYNGMSAPTAAERTTMAAASTDKFYDMLSASDRAKLNKKVKVKAGKYNYGIVETHPWVKIKAKSGTLCTKADGAKEDFSTGGDGVKSYYTVVDTLTCTEPEETLVYITNANSNFKFLEPFEVKKGDQVTLDLAVDFNQAIRAVVNDNTYSSGNLRAADGMNSFYIPMIKVGPAPRKTDEKTMVETYTLGDDTTKDQVRINIYYNSADDDKSIQAINGLILGTTLSTQTKSNKPLYTYKVSQTGDELKLKSYDDSEILTFTRGVAGTATISCSGTGGSAALEECKDKTTTTLSYPEPVISTL